jgi:NADH-quinone oxidoreductase subunit G
MIKIEIDGKEIEAEPGKMIIQVADQHSIPIPRFCYHHKLSIAANCRMCLVQVEKVAKPLPACATPISEGMKIWTTSAFTKDAQRSVMEFLLINHPLDCPICDQGGECELQDVSMAYGADRSRFEQPKRAVLDHNLGPLIATEMTRCIQCTRCVRFGTEVAGERELGATGRGEFMKIETFVAQHVNSEVSGNIIDLCPVGALTSKPFRFRARAWELQEHPFIAPHDCIGSNIYLHLKQDQVLRAVPRQAEDINEVWLSDRDRFSYEALYHADRLRKPMIKKNGKWQIVSWIEALRYAVTGIKLAIDTYGVIEFGTLLSPNATLEECYLLQQFTRALGSANIDHRLRQQDFADQDLAPQFPNLGIALNEIEKLDGILLIGSDLHKEQPLAALKVRKMSLNGGMVCAINPVEFHYNFDTMLQHVVPGGNLLTALAAVAKELLRMTKNTARPEVAQLDQIKSNEMEQQLAAKLLAVKNVAIILGPHVQMHPHAAEIRTVANLIAILLNARCGEFSDGCNAAGAWLAGCVPHRLAGGKESDTIGKNALEMLTKPLRSYLLFGIEPEYDSILGNKALENLAAADFVVAISGFASDNLLQIADVILPMALYAENSGTFINIEGKLQSFQAVAAPFGESRMGWKILRVLGNLCELSDFEYQDVQQIRDVVVKLISNESSKFEIIKLKSWGYRWPEKPRFENFKGLVRIAPLALYAVDPLVRRAVALQLTKDAKLEAVVELNSETAKQIGVAEGAMVQVTTSFGKTVLQARFNSRVPEFSVIIYQANSRTNILGVPYSMVEIKP